jgi:hypothetical protein
MFFSFHREIIPVLPVFRQNILNFPLYLKVFIYSTITRGTPNDALRNSG